MVQFHLPPVYPILDVELSRAHGWTPADLARLWLDEGVTFLQIRFKQASGGEFLALIEEILPAARERGALVIVNDRADLARMANAPGVHVGQDDLPPTDVRAIVGPDVIVGYSTHGDEQVRRALDEPVDYVAIGPVFATRSKAQPDPTVGLEGVRSARRILEPAGRPLVAIGGITIETAPAVLAAGADSVAVISDLLASDARARIRAYLDLQPPR